MTAAAAVPPGGAPPREASRLAQVSWALFDWANQPFFTLVTTFIFGPYFAGELVAGLEETRRVAELGRMPTPDELKAIRAASDAAGQSAWAFTQSASGILLALASPFLGSMADASGRRKPYMLAFQLLTALGCGLLWWALPGRPDLVLVVSAAVILATVGAEVSIVFNNSLLPRVAGPGRMGRLSGLGWGLGYSGGLIALFAVLAVQRPSLFGLGPPGGPPLFGLDAATFEVERLIGPASALWLALFVLPMFLFTPDGAPTGLSPLRAATEGARALLATVRRLGAYRNPLVYLLAYMIYNDGLAAIIAFGGVYAKGIFGWSTTTLGIFGIFVTLVAIPGCLLGGRLDDGIGSRPTVLAAIAGVFLATLGILSITAESVLFFLPAAPLAPDRGLFASTQELAFMGCAMLLGLCMGPMQAASRTLMGRLAPQGMTGEFYGLFALSGRATTWMAPLLIGIVTAATETQRWGVAVVLPFLLLGFVLLLFGVRERPARG